jgi:hypothetical protein
MFCEDPRVGAGKPGGSYERVKEFNRQGDVCPGSEEC